MARGIVQLINYEAIDSSLNKIWPGNFFYWLTAGYQISGGLMLALNRITKWISAGFMALVVSGAALLLWQNSLFVSLYGFRSLEYNGVLMISLFAIASCSREYFSISKKISSNGDQLKVRNVDFEEALSDLQK